jgi:hypothetical protein
MVMCLWTSTYPCLQLPTDFSYCFSDTNESGLAVIAGDVREVDFFIIGCRCHTCSDFFFVLFLTTSMLIVFVVITRVCVG